MKLVKSLLLGSAAGIVAVGSAVAADLPVRKAAPVDYVQVCSAFGTGFFYIPGTDTCLKFSGLVRWQGNFHDRQWVAPQAQAAADAARRARTFSMDTRFDFDVDARTATEFGTLRSFARVRNGNDLERAFIEFAGITAGKAPNVFGAYASAAFEGGGGVRGATVVDSMISYTADLGQFSATVGIMDPQFSRAATAPVTNAAPGVTAAVAYVNDATRMPDIGGNIKGSFGDVSLHLGAVATELRTAERSNAPGVTGNPYAKSATGFALTAGATIGLSAISPGTSLKGSFTYAEGALWYLNPITSAGRFSVRTREAYLIDGSVKQTKGWNLYGELSHAWTPQISQALYGVYGDVSVPSGASLVRTAGGVNYRNMTDAMGYKYWQLGTNVAFTPTAGLTFGADVNYKEIRTDHRILVSGTAGGDDARYKRNAGEWRATLRILRSF